MAINSIVSIEIGSAPSVSKEAERIDQLLRVEPLQGGNPSWLWAARCRSSSWGPTTAYAPRCVSGSTEPSVKKVRWSGLREGRGRLGGGASTSPSESEAESSPSDPSFVSSFLILVKNRGASSSGRGVHSAEKWVGKFGRGRMM